MRLNLDGKLDARTQKSRAGQTRRGSLTFQTETVWRRSGRDGLTLSLPYFLVSSIFSFSFGESPLLGMSSVSPPLSFRS